MTAPVEDPSIAPLAMLLLDCYKMEINRVEKPPQVVSLRPGDQVELLLSSTRDECCEGVAWVRVGNWYPSQDFPQPDRAPAVKGPVQWAVPLEMGAARCSPVADGKTIPSGEQWDTVTRAVMDDAAAMRRALCCLAANRGWRRMMAGQYQPLRTEGGCVGGTLQVTVAAPACDCTKETS